MWNHGTAGPDAELDAGTACVKGVGTTALGSVSAGGNDKEELASAEEDGCATGVCSAIAVVSCSATLSCTPPFSQCFVLLSKA